MTSKEFLKAITNGEADIVQLLLDILRETKTAYALVGGLAVNAYVESVVSLDLDIVVVAHNIKDICRKAEELGFSIEKFPHSINLNTRRSDIRIQIQTDERYQAFLAAAEKKTVLGYEMTVARMEDVLCGKLWEYQDDTRRKSKRQKDLADILRLVEAYPILKNLLPESIRKETE
jgi:S-adenosylmethionine synthetase